MRLWLRLVLNCAAQYERLVRRLLLYPRTPAVVLLHFFKFWAAHKGRGLPGGGDPAALEESDLAFPNNSRIEAKAALMARHYGLGSVSVSTV